MCRCSCRSASNAASSFEAAASCLTVENLYACMHVCMFVTNNVSSQQAMDYSRFEKSNVDRDSGATAPNTIRTRSRIPQDGLFRLVAPLLLLRVFVVFFLWCCACRQQSSHSAATGARPHILVWIGAVSHSNSAIDGPEIRAGGPFALHLFVLCPPGKTNRSPFSF